MGSRLVVAIRSETGWELYYDHWAVQTIGQDIAINGFEKTLKRVRAMVSLGDSLYECVKSTLIEGMLLIDMATKHVTWAEESDGLYMPRLINALVEHSWPGWTAIWSAESTDGVLQAAGIDPADIFAEKHDATRTLEGSAWFGPWGDFGDSGVFSIRLDDGRYSLTFLLRSSSRATKSCPAVGRRSGSWLSEALMTSRHSGLSRPVRWSADLRCIAPRPRDRHRTTHSPSL